MSNSEFWVPVSVLLSTLIPVGSVGLILGVVALLTHHFRAAQRVRIGGNLVHDMLQRNMSADEIERVLLAWHADPELAAKLKKQQTPLKKFTA